jgi:hypothetical protein
MPCSSSLIPFCISNINTDKILQTQFLRLIVDIFHSVFHIVFVYNILQNKPLINSQNELK